METREVFNVIERGLRADPRKSVVESFFDEDAFGNFWITFEEAGERLSIVNDRGQLILCDGPAGDRFRAMLVRDLRSADEEAVLQAVK